MVEERKRGEEKKRRWRTGRRRGVRSGCRQRERRGEREREMQLKLCVCIWICVCVCVCVCVCARARLNVCHYDINSGRWTITEKLTKAYIQCTAFPKSQFRSNLYLKYR